MHEFIVTLEGETLEAILNLGIPRGQIIPLVGKLFLDFGLHAPTVSFPEPLGLMIEPTESYSKAELDRFLEVLAHIRRLLREHPAVLRTTPHFTPVARVDEVEANRELVLSETISTLPDPGPVGPSPVGFLDLPVATIYENTLKAHRREAAK